MGTCNRSRNRKLITTFHMITLIIHAFLFDYSQKEYPKGHRKGEGMWVVVQTKLCEPGDAGAYKEDYFDFHGKTLEKAVASLADPCSYTLFKLKRFSFHGLPYKFPKQVYCSEMRDWSPPRLNKAGIEYTPSPYALSSGKRNVNLLSSGKELLTPSSYSGQIINLNDYFFDDGISSEILIMGFVRRPDNASSHVIVLVPHRRLETMDPKSVSHHLYVCELNNFINTYITDWLVTSVYDKKYEDYTPRYVGDGEVSISSSGAV